MKLLITNELNPKLFLSLIARGVDKVEYLKPNNNIIYKFIIYILSILLKINFQNIKMGKSFTKDGQKIYKLALIKTNEEIFKLKKEIYDKSNFYLLNVMNEREFNTRLWMKFFKFYLIKLYAKEKKYEPKIKNLFLLENNNPLKKTYSRFTPFKNFLIIESLRFISNFVNKIHGLTIRQSKSKKKLSIKTQDLFLLTDGMPKSNKDLFYRNQITLSKNITGKNSFVILDYKNKKLFSNEKVIEIEKESINNYLFFLKDYLPKVNEYFSIKFKFNLFDVLSFLKINYFIWSLTKDVDFKNFYINYVSSEALSFIFLSKAFKRNLFIYQGSLQGQIFPDQFHPYANSASFTKLNQKLYLKVSREYFNNSNSARLGTYPYNSDLNSIKNGKLKNKISKKFSLSIAYFDEAMFNKKINDREYTSHYFYEDLKKDIYLLVELVNRNNELFIIFKSKYISNSILRLIEEDKDLKKLYKKDQIIDLVHSSDFNMRNLVSPSEIGQIADICIGSSWGGTACYESYLRGSRAVLIKSGISVYDEILSKNVLFNSLEDILEELKKLNYSRKELLASNLGKFKFDL